jgi:hypothetical protein
MHIHTMHVRYILHAPSCILHTCTATCRQNSKKHTTSRFCMHAQDDVNNNIEYIAGSQYIFRRQITNHAYRTFSGMHIEMQAPMLYIIRLSVWRNARALWAPPAWWANCRTMHVYIYSLSTHASCLFACSLITCTPAPCAQQTMTQIVTADASLDRTCE